MPKMGRSPVSKDTRNHARIGRKTQRSARNAKSPTREINPNEKFDQKLVNKLSGKAPDTIYKNGRHNEMGKDEFLKLLSHQLRNQDPMNPMDQNKFAADLAQFAQLEQLSNMNSKFDKLNPNVGMEDKFYGASFLGKKVITDGGSVSYKGGGEDADIYFNLPQKADKVVIRVLDKQGNIVTEQWKEGMSAGAHKTSWDGNDLAGNPENAGEFRIAVQAWDETGGLVPTETKVEGVVQSVFFENGETVFIVDGKKVFMRDIDSFHVPEEKQARQAIDKAAKQNTNRAKQNAQAINTYKNNSGLDRGNAPVYDN